MPGELHQNLRDQLQASGPGARTGVIALLFTDIVGSTQLKRLLGDEAGVRCIHDHQEVVRSLLSRYPDSVEINTAGDSFFIAFGRVEDAIRFALLLQHHLRQRAADESHPILLRIGIHIGEALLNEHRDGRLDLYGLEVDIAARVMGLAGADQILLSRAAADAARDRLGPEPVESLQELQWMDHGFRRLKGGDTRLEIVEVGERGQAPFLPPPDLGAGTPWLRRGLIITAVLALGFYVWSLLPGPPSRPTNRRSSRNPAIPTVAVLPLTNQVRQAATLDLLGGLAHNLSARLAGATNLRVITPAEVLDAPPQTPADAGRRFGCDLVLTLSVTAESPRTRLVVALVDTDSLQQREAETLETGGEDVTGHERLASVVARWFGIPVRSDLLPTANARAYEAYLGGVGTRSRYEPSENPEKAIRHLTEAVLLDPSFAVAHAELAISYLHALTATRDTNFLRLAHDHANQAVGLNTEIPEGRHALGCVLHRMGLHEDASRQCERAAQMRPQDPAIIGALALCYQARGRTNDAENLYKTALDRNPDSWELRRDLGTFYVSETRLQEAEAQFREVIRIVPDNDTGYRDLGGLLYFLGRDREAEEALLKSLQIRRQAEALSNLGSLHFIQGRYDDASREYLEAVELKPRRYEFWGNLGEARHWAGAPRETVLFAFRRAIDIVQAELAISPNPGSTRAWLAWYLQSSGNPDSAGRELERALQEEPGDPEVLFLAALVSESAGNRPAACDFLDQACARGYPPREVLNHPALTGIRSDACFSRVRARLGTPTIPPAATP